MASQAAANDLQSYLVLVPRGLHHTAKDLVEEGLQKWTIQLAFVGESASQRDNTAYTQQLSKELAETRDRNNKRKQVTSATCRLPVGSVSLGDTNLHVSIGYSDSNQQVWTGNGQLQGSCLMKIVTNAPVDLLANSTRCLGPLLALIGIWEDLELGESKSLEETFTCLTGKVEATGYSLDPALALWEAHVKASWGLSEEELADLKAKLEGKLSLKYRLSCFRTESKNHKYTRQELLSSVADLFVPEQSHGTKWTVDLKNYDVEVALLFRPHCLAIGLALRPYKQLGAKSFATGLIPPDVSPPYLSGRVLSGLVRLRPSTAHILLSLAKLKPGDIVLDPCAGIGKFTLSDNPIRMYGRIILATLLTLVTLQPAVAGTIPMETLFGPSPIVALGGDLVLTPDKLAPVASTYSTKALARQRGLDPRISSVANLMAFDAGNLPVRTGIADVVVTDLPFGQLCLSSTKLDNLLPLIIGEASRVLRRGSGRMVLLCGSYAQILDAILQTNGSASDVWELPCSAVFPVNIGGLLAWVVQVKRGNGIVTQLPKHLDRVRKLTRKRQLVALQQKNDLERHSKAQK